MSSRSNSKRLPSDDNVASDGGLRRREFYLNGPSLDRASKRITEGVLSPPNLKNSHKSKGSHQLHSEASGSNSRKGESNHGIHVSAGNDDLSTTQKPRKVKLKIGGISRTIPAKPNPAIPDSRSSAAKPTRPGDSLHRQKHGNQVNNKWSYLLFRSVPETWKEGSFWLNRRKFASLLNSSSARKTVWCY